MKELLVYRFTGSESGSEQVLVGGVPAQAGDLQVLRALKGEVPERQKGTFRFPELVGGVLPKPEIWEKSQHFIWVIS